MTPQREDLTAAYQGAEKESERLFEVYRLAKAEEERALAVWRDAYSKKIDLAFQLRAEQESHGDE